MHCLRRLVNMFILNLGWPIVLVCQFLALKVLCSRKTFSSGQTGAVYHPSKTPWRMEYLVTVARQWRWKLRQYDIFYTSMLWNKFTPAKWWSYKESLKVEHRKLWPLTLESIDCETIAKIVLENWGTEMRSLQSNYWCVRTSRRLGKDWVERILQNALKLLASL